jgi:hypothetical protein
MKHVFRWIAGMVAIAAMAWLWPAGAQAAGGNAFVITDNDVAGPNSFSAFKLTGSSLTFQATLPTGENGIGQTFVALNEVAIFVDSTDQCVFVTDAGSGDIAAFKEIHNAATKTGSFKDAKGSGSTNGIGLAVSGSYLFAAYTASSNIGVWSVEPGCKLKLLGTYKTARAVGGIRATPNGKTLVVGYDAGVNAVDSFSIGVNGKLTEHGPYVATGGAAGVDITKDSKYAIFGDATRSATQVEIYPINANGSLGKDHNFGGDGGLGAGVNSNNVWLSPNEKFLFVSNNFSKQVTSLGFSEKPLGLSYINITTLNDRREIIGGITTAMASGNGGFIYVAEATKPNSQIGMLQINADGSTTEVSGSPFVIASGGGHSLESLAAYPPRGF